MRRRGLVAGAQACREGNAVGGVPTLAAATRCKGSWGPAAGACSFWRRRQAFVWAGHGGRVGSPDEREVPPLLPCHERPTPLLPWARRRPTRSSTLRLISPGRSALSWLARCLWNSPRSLCCCRVRGKTMPSCRRRRRPRRSRQQRRPKLGLQLRARRAWEKCRRFLLVHSTRARCCHWQGVRCKQGARRQQQPRACQRGRSRAQQDQQQWQLSSRQMRGRAPPRRQERNKRKLRLQQRVRGPAARLASAEPELPQTWRLRRRLCPRGRISHACVNNFKQHRILLERFPFSRISSGLKLPVLVSDRGERATLCPARQVQAVCQAAPQPPTALHRLPRWLSSHWPVSWL